LKHTIFRYDPLLKAYEKDFDLRKQNFENKKKELLAEHSSLKDFASGHLYFGFHKQKDGWYYREWAPGAEQMFLTGDFCNWDRYAHPMEKGDNGVFSLFLPGTDTLKNGQKVMAVVVSGGKELERIPLYIHRVEQDPVTIAWNGVICDPEKPYQWKDSGFKPQKKLFIYECHIGMAQEEGRVGTYEEFRIHILPKIAELGYNTIQIMAIMEHPYYASFGYQVTNFFAASSRFGTPEALRSSSILPIKWVLRCFWMLSTPTPVKTPGRASTNLTALTTSSSTREQRVSILPGIPSALTTIKMKSFTSSFLICGTGWRSTTLTASVLTVSLLCCT